MKTHEDNFQVCPKAVDNFKFVQLCPSIPLFWLFCVPLVFLLLFEAVNVIFFQLYKQLPGSMLEFSNIE